MNRLVIFDCDGTLVDSGATIHRALGAAFEAHGLQCPDRAVSQRVIGLSLDEAMAMLAPNADHAALSATYRDAFFTMRGAGEVHEPLYDGIAALVERLHGDGWLLGVATGKSDRGLNHVLAAHGMTSRFATLQTADRHPSKPHPAMALAAMAEAGAAPETTVFLGDTGWDMGCARNAGCGAIGAAWGYHDHADLIAAGADAVADHPIEVVALAEQFTKAAA